MGGRVGPPPAIGTVGDKNFSPASIRREVSNRAEPVRGFTTKRAFALVASVQRGRSAYATEEGSIEKNGVGDLKTAKATSFGVSQFNFLSKTGFTKIID